MEKYKNLNVGDIVISINGNLIYHNYREAKNPNDYRVPAGTVIKILDFPALVTKDPNYTHYIIGKDVLNEQTVTCFPCDVVKDSSKKIRKGNKVIITNNNVKYFKENIFIKNIEFGTEVMITDIEELKVYPPYCKYYYTGITNNGEIIKFHSWGIRKVTNKPIDKILYPVSGRNGAQSGRDSIGKRPKNKRIFDCRVPLSADGAYERSTCVYWGIGKELRVKYTKDLSYIRFYRVGDKL